MTSSSPSSGSPRPPRWWVPVLLLVVALGFLASPLYRFFASWVANPGWWGTKPGRLEGSLHLFLYGGLAAVTLAVYLTFDDDRWQRFLDGLASALVPRSLWRWILLAVLPVGGAARLLAGVLGTPRPPPTIYQMHPTPPESFSLATNPFRDPPEEDIEAFVDSIRAGRIDTASSTEPRVVALGEAVRAGSATAQDARLAYKRWCIEEGRNHYQILCRPCHGTKANGRGPQARAFTRAPLAFTDPGTIQTLAEGPSSGV